MSISQGPVSGLEFKEFKQLPSQVAYGLAAASDPYSEDSSPSCCERMKVVCERAIEFLQDHPLETASGIVLIGIVAYLSPLAGTLLLVTAITALAVAHGILNICRLERHPEFEDSDFSDDEIKDSPILEQKEHNGSYVHVEHPDEELSDDEAIAGFYSLVPDEKKTHFTSLNDSKTPESLNKYKGPGAAFFNDVPDLHNVLNVLGYQSLHGLPMLQISDQMMSHGFLPSDMDESVMAGVYKGKPVIAVKFDTQKGDEKLQKVRVFVEKDDHISAQEHGADDSILGTTDHIYLTQFDQCTKLGSFKYGEYTLTIAKPKTSLPITLD